MNKNLIITAFLGMLTIILGAFGAHALKATLSPEDLLAYDTAIRYQMYHVLFLLFINTTTILSLKHKTQLSNLVYLGILFFCGSIYAITVGGVNPKSIWFITPLGGLFFIVAWLMLAIILIKSKKPQA